MFKLAQKILLVLMVAITAAAVAQPVFAGIPLHLISLTENSPVSLTLKYDGVDITATGVLNTAQDQWTVTLPASVQIDPLDVGAWFEPENPLLLNKAFRGNSPANVLNVFSDNSLFPEAIVVNDGVAVLVGTDSSDNLPVEVVFHDLAASSEVPDAGPTAMLLGIGLAGIGWLRRKIC